MACRAGSDNPARRVIPGAGKLTIFRNLTSVGDLTLWTIRSEKSYGKSKIGLGFPFNDMLDLRLLKGSCSAKFSASRSGHRRKKCAAFFDDFFQGYTLFVRSIFLIAKTILDVSAMKNNAEFWFEVFI